MELIPILSTIILVATISTFILAVGAYILYKIREGRIQRQPVRQPAELHAEYVVPKEKPVRKVFVEDILESKPVKKLAEDRFKPVIHPSEISDRYEETAAEAAKRKSESEKVFKARLEMPKERYVKINVENLSEREEEFKPGEIKWR